MLLMIPYISNHNLKVQINDASRSLSSGADKGSKGRLNEHWAIIWAPFLGSTFSEKVREEKKSES